MRAERYALPNCNPRLGCSTLQFAGFVIHGYLGGRTLFTKSVGLAFSVASGLTLGKEGPFVHIASCIGNIVSRFFTKYENNEGAHTSCRRDASAESRCREA
jgi:chloride channel 3/4/5